MYFVMYNSVVLSKILKIVVPLEQNFENSIFDSIKLIIFSQNGTTILNILDNTTELWMTKYKIGEFCSSGGATFYKNSSDQTVCVCVYVLWNFHKIFKPQPTLMEFSSVDFKFNVIELLCNQTYKIFKPEQIRNFQALISM